MKLQNLSQEECSIVRELSIFRYNFWNKIFYWIEPFYAMPWKKLYQLKQLHFPRANNLNKIQLVSMNKMKWWITPQISITPIKFYPSVASTRNCHYQRSIFNGSMIIFSSHWYSKCFTTAPAIQNQLNNLKVVVQQSKEMDWLASIDHQNSTNR